MLVSSISIRTAINDLKNAYVYKRFGVLLIPYFESLELTVKELAEKSRMVSYYEGSLDADGFVPHIEKIVSQFPNNKFLLENISNKRRNQEERRSRNARNRSPFSTPFSNPLSTPPSTSTSASTTSVSTL